jgi:hypothetical protein
MPGSLSPEPAAHPPAYQPYSAPPQPYSAAPAYPAAPASAAPQGYPGGVPVSAVPASGMPAGYPPQQYTAPQPSRPGPVHVEQVPGTEFGVAYLRVPPTVSGLAVGAMIAGIASILVAFIIGCAGVAGLQNESIPIIAGAFAVLAALLSFAGLGLGYASTRQIRNGRGRFSGRGMGVTGMVCGGVGILFTSGGVLLALALVAT